jgi:hypothetical protein
MVDIDVEAVAADLGTDANIVWGRLYHHLDRLYGGRWITRFGVEMEGPQHHRHVWVQDTELVQRGDGKTLVPPESFQPEAWYTPTGLPVKRWWRWSRP